MIRSLIEKQNVFTLAFLLLIVVPSLLRADKFYINSAAKTDSVYFESSAKLEFIQGKTAAILGYLNFDAANTSTAEGYLRVDAASLKTGIEMRDEHMRNKHLHTDKFPYIEFKLKSVSGLPASLTSSTLVNCQVTGDFSIHGTTKTITLPATVEWREGSGGEAPKSLSIDCRLSIKLDDYQVPRPKALFMKLAETINIIVKFTASTANPAIVF